MGRLTQGHIIQTDDEKERYKKVLEQLAGAAESIEFEEHNYKSNVEHKLERIHTFMTKVHEVLRSTYKEEELESLLKDLEAVAHRSGIQQTAFSKDNDDDRVGRYVQKANKEISGIKKLEEEREYKNSIEKLGLVGLVKQLQRLINDIEISSSEEKRMLTNEIQ